MWSALDSCKISFQFALIDTDFFFFAYCANVSSICKESGCNFLIELNLIVLINMSSIVHFI